MSLLTFIFKINSRVDSYSENYSKFKNTCNDLIILYNKIREQDLPNYLENKKIFKENLSNINPKPYLSRLNTQDIEKFLQSQTTDNNFSYINSVLLQDLRIRYLTSIEKILDNYKSKSKHNKKPLGFPKLKDKNGISSLKFPQYNKGFKIDLDSKTVTCNKLNSNDEGHLKFDLIINDSDLPYLKNIFELSNLTKLKRKEHIKSQQSLPKKLTKKEKDKLSQEELNKLTFRKDFEKSDDDFEIKSAFLKEEKGELSVGIVVSGPFTKDFSKNIFSNYTTKKSKNSETKQNKIKLFLSSKRKRDKARRRLYSKKNLIKNVLSVSDSEKELIKSVYSNHPDLKIKPVDNTKSIAMDFGCGYNNSVVLSNGMRFSLPFELYKLSENLRKLHSIYDSAKNKESKHSVRISLKINEIERRIVNIRKDYLHKVSKFIVKLAIDGDMSSIIIDDISSNNIVKGRNKWINKSIYNNAFSILKFNIKYNTEIANKSYNKNINVVLADPSYSSQICPVCLNHKKKSLDEREHICEKCGIRIDRDLSSAILMDKVNSSRQLPTGVDQIRTFDKVFEDLIL